MENAPGFFCVDHAALRGLSDDALAGALNGLPEEKPMPKNLGGLTRLEHRPLVVMLSALCEEEWRRAMRVRPNMTRSRWVRRRPSN